MSGRCSRSPDLDRSVSGFLQRTTAAFTKRPIRHTSIRRFSQRPDPGRRSTHRSGEPVQTNRTTSMPLRQRPPRTTDLDAMTEADIQEIAMTLNLTPRKCLGFKSPIKAFLAELKQGVNIRFSSTRCTSCMNVPLAQHRRSSPPAALRRRPHRLDQGRTPHPSDRLHSAGPSADTDGGRNRSSPRTAGTLGLRIGG